jgi:filamentous hemagglutinin family protein
MERTKMRNTTTIQSGYHLIFRNLFSVCLACLSVLLICMPAHAVGINTDGSLGPATTLMPGGPKGHDYTIPSNLGQQRGSNLFHSFGNFNVDTGYTATFTGSAGTTNVIGRVTGGNSSWIDGSLGCDITGANLWLLNPFGILFGPNASLNVNGSFHASTADYLQLSDGGVFYTDPSKTSKLTIAAPSAFGFLSSKPESIEIKGSTLKVPEGESISIIGGDIRIEDGCLVAPGGRVDLASLGSPGTVEIVSDGLKVEATHGLGNINISNAKSAVNIDVSGVDRGDIDISGSVDIYCKTFSLNYGEILSNNYGKLYKSGKIRLAAEESISLDNFSDIFSHSYGEGAGADIDIQTIYLALTHVGQIVAITDGRGDGGDITIKAKEVLIEGRSIDGSYPSMILCQTESTGNAGSLSINTESLTLFNGGRISAPATGIGSGNGGDIFIKAKDILIDGGWFESTIGFKSSSITCQSDPNRTGAAGNAGNLNIDTESLILSNGGLLATSTNGSGNGGNISISAKKVWVDGHFESSNDFSLSKITSQADLGSAGNAGSLNIDTESLILSNGGRLVTATLGSGDGGNIMISAKNVWVDGAFKSNNGLYSSKISCQTEFGGNAGSLDIDTESLSLSNGGQISASTFGSGDGGNIKINAKHVWVDGGFESSYGFDASLITCQTNPGSTGNAGSLNIDTESLSLSNGGQISASTYGSGDGGDVIIKAKDLLMIAGEIDTYSSSRGTAGSINIQTKLLEMNSGASISSASTGTGDAGSIIIAANDSMLLNDATITVEASKASAGDIKIQTPNLDVTNTSQITASVSGGSGSGGRIDLNVGALSITEGSRIESNTAGSGSGGNITVAAGTSVTISGKTEEASGMYSTSTGTGSAGFITVKTPNLNISDSGEISSSASGTGHGGSIDINVTNLNMTSGAVISSASTGTGDAGNINLTIADKLESRNSTITTESTKADGGDITITNTSFLTYLINSSITATVGGGSQTTGGNIRINSPYVVLKDSHVIANAYEGKGGNIDITADTYLADWTSTVSASSALGISGQVDINSPLVNLSGLLSPLPTAFVDVTEFLADDCETRYKYRKVSSLVVRGRDALPAQPGDLWPSPVMMR